MKREPLPRTLGYRMPAEWDPHAATWLTWPRRDGISFPGRFEPIPEIWLRMLELLTPHEDVHVNTFDDEQESEIRQLLEQSKTAVRRRVFLHRFPAYEPWCRDHGPIFLTRDVAGRRELALVDWQYNAWGGKYPPYDLDDAIPQRIAAFLGVPRFQPGMVLEGGSIDVNGRGTLLTTESCLLHLNRNPHLNRSAIEACLCGFLGVSHVLWLGDGIVGDDTDGHIDDIARFVNPTTIVVAAEDDPLDENFHPLRENLNRLEKMSDQDGQPLRVVPLPMPRAVVADGRRLPASYANFYIANSVVLVPGFSDPNDARALSVLQAHFPDRPVVVVPALDLIRGRGAFHCVTQQQPLCCANIRE